MGFEDTGEGFFLCHPLFGPKFVFEKRQLLAVFVGQRVPLREADKRKWQKILIRFFP